MGLYRQSLKAELRRQIWLGMQRDPLWRTLNHKQRKAIAKKKLREIWDSATDRESLAHGVDWSFRRDNENEANNGPI